ncbi:HrpE family protein [Xanthomonas campestris]|uniref:HrpE family protein n=1 Tax=Xanthomonas cannabis TaxID=1885674 RepID=UPI001E2966A7|nr:serine kinase [Xanthomonas campestris pv. zinniae]
MLSQLDSFHSRFDQGKDGHLAGFKSDYSNHNALNGSDEQIDSLLSGLEASDEKQKGMNNKITMLKNDLDFNVTLNKFIGKAGDNAKQLVGQ